MSYLPSSNYLASFKTLDRNKIYSIGKEPKTITLKQIETQTNAVLDAFEIYKTIRRKNKIIAYGLNGKVELTFATIEDAENHNKMIRKEIKEL